MEGEVDRLSLTDSEELYKPQDCNLDESQSSPFSKSRYGRTRKPKISQDFYNIDVIFDTAKESKKSPRVSLPMKLQSTPKLKSKSSQSLIDDEDLKKENKAPLFVHITADSELESIPLPPSPVKTQQPLVIEEVAPVTSPKVLKKFFKRETEVSSKLNKDNLNLDPSTSSLSEDVLNNIDALNVSEVLKIIAPAKLGDCDSSSSDTKCAAKPMLKTYSNKRRIFSKPGVVESFALPDKPIFPVQDETNSKINEPKRYKDLDVPSTSDTDINLMDKSLLNTPWKIASINTDMSTSETLLDPTYDVVTDTRLDDDIYPPVNSNSSIENEDVDERSLQGKLVDALQSTNQTKTNDLPPLENTSKENISTLVETTEEPNRDGIKSQHEPGKSKNKHKHKSSKHVHKDKKDGDRLKTHSDNDTLSKKHKSSKSKGHHKEKHLKSNKDETITEKLTEADAKKTTPSSEDKSKHRPKENKMADKLDTPTSSSSSKSKQKTMLNNKHAKNKDESKKNPETSFKQNRINKTVEANKKKLKPSGSFLKIFDEPLFSVPDATIKISTSTKERSKTDNKEKSAANSLKENSIKDKNFDIKKKSIDISVNEDVKDKPEEVIINKSKKHEDSKAKDKSSQNLPSIEKVKETKTKTEFKEKVKENLSSSENTNEDIKRKKKHPVLIKDGAKDKTDSLLTVKQNKARVSDINRNDMHHTKGNKKHKSLTHSHKESKIKIEKRKTSTQSSSNETWKLKQHSETKQIEIQNEAIERNVNEAIMNKGINASSLCQSDKDGEKPLVETENGLNLNKNLADTEIAPQIETNLTLANNFQKEILELKPNKTVESEHPAESENDINVNQKVTQIGIVSTGNTLNEISELELDKTVTNLSEDCLQTENDVILNKNLPRMETTPQIELDLSIDNSHNAVIELEFEESVDESSEHSAKVENDLKINKNRIPVETKPQTEVGHQAETDQTTTQDEINLSITTNKEESFELELDKAVKELREHLSNVNQIKINTTLKEISETGFKKTVEESREHFTETVANLNINKNVTDINQIETVSQIEINLTAAPNTQSEISELKLDKAANEPFTLNYPKEKVQKSDVFEHQQTYTENNINEIIGCVPLQQEKHVLKSFTDSKKLVIVSDKTQQPEQPTCKLISASSARTNKKIVPNPIKSNLFREKKAAKELKVVLENQNFSAKRIKKLTMENGTTKHKKNITNDFLETPDTESLILEKGAVTTAPTREESEQVLQRRVSKRIAENTPAVLPNEENQETLYENKTPSKSENSLSNEPLLETITTRLSSRKSTLLNSETPRPKDVRVSKTPSESSKKKTENLPTKKENFNRLNKNMDNIKTLKSDQDLRVEVKRGRGRPRKITESSSLSNLEALEKTSVLENVETQIKRKDRLSANTPNKLTDTALLTNLDAPEIPNKKLQKSSFLENAENVKTAIKEKLRRPKKDGTSTLKENLNKKLDQKRLLVDKTNDEEAEEEHHRYNKKITSRSLIELRPKKEKALRSSTTSATDISDTSFKTSSRLRRAVSVCCSIKNSDAKSSDKDFDISAKLPIRRSQRMAREDNSDSLSNDTHSTQKDATSQKHGLILSTGRRRRALSVSGKHLYNEDKNVPSKESDAVKTPSKRDSLEYIKDLDLRNQMVLSNIQIGDLLWARIGNYPYWPCLITEDPESGTFEKTVSKNLCYHVRFFGDNGRRSWISSISLMRFNGAKDLQKLCNYMEGHCNKSSLQKYSVKSCYLSKWEIAVAEANSMKSKSIKERLKFFMVMLDSSPNKKKQPLVSSQNEDVKKSKQSKLSSNRSHLPVKSEPLDNRFIRSKSLPAFAFYSKPSRNTPAEEKQNKHLGENKKDGSSPIVKTTIAKIKEKTPELPSEGSERSLIRGSTHSMKADKKDVDKSVIEANSECSLSDSDTFSKSSSSTVVAPSSFQELIMRQKRNNLFKGIPKHRVCQICTKPSEVLRCQGPCNGIFHYKCANNLIAQNNSPLSKHNTSLDNTLVKDPQTAESIKTSDMVSSTGDVINSNNLDNSSISTPRAARHSFESDANLVLPKSVDYSVAEQIDLKMKEVMSLQDNYADSTTDYTSSEETLANYESSAEVAKKKTSKLKHVTADCVSHCAGSSEDVNGEDTSVGKAGNKIVAKIGSLKGVGNRQMESAVGSDTNEDFKCRYCSLDIAPPCFACEKEVSTKKVSLRQKCSLKKCGRFYHPHCLKFWPQTQWSLISTIKHKDSEEDLDTFVCPAHVCHTCSSDNPRTLVSRCPSNRIVSCLRCPATYHSTNYCVPAGTNILTNSQIICPRHFLTQKTKKKFSRTINTSWCFICSKGGDLVCCETCPTSVHIDCLHVNYMEDGTFICEDCETGRFPLYDEIVWVKLGSYRWWPATILFPTEVPENIQNMRHNKGDFVVKFFGTHDHYWVGRGRVFLFQEGDRHSTSVKTKVDVSFVKAVEEAALAHQLKNAFVLSMKAEIQTDIKPPPYIRVKNNRPVGNVRTFDPNISNTTPCECSPTHPNPCGPDSDCLNRILLTECDPSICPAKDKCNNQRFEKRQYPPLEPYKTETRGWGLKTLAPIRKGDFVIEYVGELIDEQEYQRRIQKMGEQKDENYYFLTIDKDRIIDAGPKGNLARFMNHSCQPNCETQKWTVNGDTRVGLFALVDIPADSEVTFNYHLQCVGKEKKVCVCGAPKCSGFIGMKTKLDESQKKVKKNGIKRKRDNSTPPPNKNNGPCFICGQTGDVGACHNKMCTKFYHLKCMKFEVWPEGKWVCPWHNCNVCGKRTIRCCVKCINSYCPVHSDGNVRYDNLLGFVCSEHDPTKESQELSNQGISPVKSTSSAINVHTEETDVTSTTLDESDHMQSIKNSEKQLQKVTKLEPSMSTPIKKKNFTSFVHTLEAFEEGFTKADFKNNSKADETVTQGTKRKRSRQNKDTGNASKKIKLSSEVKKPKPTYSAPSIIDMPVQNEVKLSSTVPTRHLRTTRKVSSTESEIKQLIKRQSEYEKDLPIRKRTRPRCEVNL